MDRELAVRSELAGLSATESDATALAALTNHESDTTNIHGIANTANLVLTNDARLSDARTPLAHDHNTIYYTETEVDAFLAGKSNTGHGHAFTEITGTATDAQIPSTIARDTEVSAAVTAHTTAYDHTLIHTRQHSITSTTDHTFPGDATKFLNGTGAFTTPAGGSSPAWAGNLQLAMGNGTPTWDRVISAYGNAAHTVAGPQPTQIGATVGRLMEFEVPYSITVNRLRIWTVGATANLYTLAIYTAAGARQIWMDGITTAANAWYSGAVAAVTLSPGTYWLGLGTKNVGTTSGFRTPAAPIEGFTGTATLPGNLSTTYGQARIAQVTLVAGAWPATLPALVAPAWAGGVTGSLPLVYLDANGAA